MYTYSQPTGILTRNGATAGQGYSGHGAGRNNPAMQAARDMGPIPQGQYKIGPPMVERSGSRRIGRIKAVEGMHYLVIAEASGQDFVCQALVEVRNGKDVPKFGENGEKDSSDC
jgi:hypothetical protein